MKRILFLLTLVAGLVAASSAQATFVQKFKLCHCPPGNLQNCQTKYLPLPGLLGHLNNHPFDYQGQCRIPEPEPEPEPVPTPEEPTPTPTSIPTPTEEPREVDPWDCSVDHSCHYDAAPPVCTDGTILDIPYNAHVVRFGSKADVVYGPTGGNLVDVYFKENSAPDWTHAKGDQPNNGFVEIDSLDPALGYTFGIRQHEGCGGGETVIAVIIDPPAMKPTIFRMNYWVWR